MASLAYANAEFSLRDILAATSHADRYSITGAAGGLSSAPAPGDPNVSGPTGFVQPGPAHPLARSGIRAASVSTESSGASKYLVYGAVGLLGVGALFLVMRKKR